LETALSSNRFGFGIINFKEIVFGSDIQRRLQLPDSEFKVRLDALDVLDLPRVDYRHGLLYSATWKKIEEGKMGEGAHINDRMETLQFYFQVMDLCSMDLNLSVTNTNEMTRGRGGGGGREER
jgi:hypothetical protein